MLKKPVIFLGIMLVPFAVGIGFGIYFVEHVWQVDFGSATSTRKLRRLLVFLCGVAGMSTVLVPLLIYASIRDRRILQAARAALDSSEYAAAFELLQPLLYQETCGNRKGGDQVIALVKEMYDRVGMETSISTIAELHHQYYELYEPHKNYEGIVHDENVSQELERIAEECRSLCETLPAPSNGGHDAF